MLRFLFKKKVKIDITEKLIAGTQIRIEGGKK